MKKKFLFLALLALFAVSLSACSKSETTINNNVNVDLSDVAEIKQNNNSSENSLNSDAQLNSEESISLTSTSSGKVADDSQASEKEIITMQKINTSNKNMTVDPKTFENLSGIYSGAIIKTSLGDIKVKFYAVDSPNTVNNFLNLAKLGFYNETKFHRVISGFMIQGGDPISKTDDTAYYGTGGPGYRFADEFNKHKLVEGSLAMANSGPNTNGSQFFIVTAAETPWLDGAHTNFGQVVSGMDVVKKIEAAETNARDLPLKAITINSVELVK